MQRKRKRQNTSAPEKRKKKDDGYDRFVFLVGSAEGSLSAKQETFHVTRGEARYYQQKVTICEFE